MRRNQFIYSIVAGIGLLALTIRLNGDVEPGFLSWRVRAKQSPRDGYRVAVIHETASSKARVIAIQKTGKVTEEETLVPRFCQVEHVDGNPVMYVDGRAVSPQRDLIAYFGGPDKKPQRVILDREAYERIAGDGILPSRSDGDLWDLCIMSERRNQH